VKHARGIFPALLLGAGWALASLGCGYVPEAPVPEPSASPSSVPPTSPVGPVGSPREFVTRAQETFRKAPGYRTELHYFQKKGDRTVRGVYDVTGRPGKAMRIVIVKGDSPGTRILWEGGKTAKVRPAGLLSPFVVTLDVTDDRLISIRGYTLDQFELGGILGLYDDPAARLVQAGLTGTVYQVAIASPNLFSGCKQLVMTFDARSFHPLTMQMRDDREPVVGMEIRNLRVTPEVDLTI